jgi:hypothetical protein
MRASSSRAPSLRHDVWRLSAEDLRRGEKPVVSRPVQRFAMVAVCFFMSFAVAAAIGAAMGGGR